MGSNGFPDADKAFAMRSNPFRYGLTFIRRKRRTKLWSMT